MSLLYCRIIFPQTNLSFWVLLQTKYAKLLCSCSPEGGVVTPVIGQVLIWSWAHGVYMSLVAAKVSLSETSKSQIVLLVTPLDPVNWLLLISQFTLFFKEKPWSSNFEDEDMRSVGYLACFPFHRRDWTHWFPSCQQLCRDGKARALPFTKIRVSWSLSSASTSRTCNRPLFEQLLLSARRICSKVSQTYVCGLSDVSELILLLSGISYDTQWGQHECTEECPRFIV